MPAESRFRLERPFDIVEAFAQRRRSSGVGILIDDERPEPARPLRIWARGGGGRTGRGIAGRSRRRALRDITAGFERRRAGDANDAAEGQLPSLLSSIEELKRLKKTPSHKQAEWERKLRTLMSMR